MITEEQIDRLVKLHTPTSISLTQEELALLKEAVQAYSKTLQSLLKAITPAQVFVCKESEEGESFKRMLQEGDNK